MTTQVSMLLNPEQLNAAQAVSHNIREVSAFLRGNMMANDNAASMASISEEPNTKYIDRLEAESAELKAQVALLQSSLLFLERLMFATFKPETADTFTVEVEGGAA
ncbi:MAG: hypothetical protein PHE17_05320 [Thiothrix sp.]|uniref:hypothetical protein n=1 Tax=Thiothrix sp. TaxID=1032 RepID=UPI00261923C5|nr:hypothetical protein [Thiothrix sp.]MDD5392422.1 hypothetical protein [Thiothrix sp.]